jgi:tRNA threonylcarbamoyladenosine biosynthesis protein TsaB
MKVLGIETASRVCGAAVADEGRIVVDVWVEARNVHAERLMPLIEEVLSGAKTTLGALDALAVSAGPGSFTGLRVGVSVAKGLAFATGKPLAGVPTLLALAERAVRESPRPLPEIIVPVLDARREEVYFQIFCREDEEVTSLSEPDVARVDDVCRLLAGRGALLTGEAAGKVLDAAGEEGELVRARNDVARCSAGLVALLGESMVRDGVTVDPAVFEPRYIKEFFLKAPHP